MCGECEEKEIFDVMINVRHVLYHKAGSLVSCESCKFFYGNKGCLSVRHLWFVKKLMC